VDLKMTFNIPVCRRIAGKQQQSLRAEEKAEKGMARPIRTCIPTQERVCDVHMWEKNTCVETL